MLDYLATIRHIWLGHQSRRGHRQREGDPRLVCAQSWAAMQQYNPPRAKSEGASLRHRGTVAAAISQQIAVAEGDVRPRAEVHIGWSVVALATGKSSKDAA